VVAEPITHERALRCTAERAFHVYTSRICDWWDPRYTANAETLETVTIEPRQGGRVFARHSDLGVDDWGEAVREKFGDWDMLLDRFAAAAEQPDELIRSS
jgi:hypothetical protein